MDIPFVLTILWALCLRNVHSKIFTSTSQMDILLGTLSTVHQIVNDYTALQETRLALLKKYHSHISDELEKANKDAEEYLSNPINDYILIKRLTADWNIAKNVIFDDFHRKFENNITTQLENVLFPTDEDLNGAATGLIRVQDTYQLKTESVARGELNGIQTSTELAYDDCFRLGKIAHDIRDYYLMYSWMIESLRRYESKEHKHKTEGNIKTIQKWEILDYLAHGSLIAGNALEALKWTYELLVSHPGFENTVKESKFYKELLKEGKLNRNISEFSIDDFSFKLESPIEYNRMRHKQLCRKEIELPVHITSQLVCRYANYNKPFLLLAPFKEEEAFLNPRILIFREVLYPSEIDIIKKLSLPYLESIGEEIPLDSAFDAVDCRIKKNYWLAHSAHSVISKINQRIEDMTSITKENIEPFMIANYGIGGGYDPHYDFQFDHYSNTKSENELSKDLLATVLFYMSNVAIGGATTFPQINVTVWPEIGSAVFWYNLKPDGYNNYLSVHGSCPVLLGSKWVCNKWLQYNGNEFLQPCPLSNT